MQIVNGTVTYYPSLPYRQHNIRLPFGWTLFIHKDAWSCDIQISNQNSKLDLLWWRRYNTLYGMAWKVIVMGLTVKSAIASKACG